MLLTHTVREDLILYAVVQTAPRGYVVVPEAETRPASEDESREAVRERLDELVHYAELLNVDEAALRQLWDVAIADYEPLRAWLMDWPVGPELNTRDDQQNARG